MRKALREEQENKNRNKSKKQRLNKCKEKVQIDKKKIIALTVCIIVIVTVIVINNYDALGLVLNKNINSDDVVKIELPTSNNKIIPFGNDVLVYNNGTLTSYNNYGRQVWKITLEDTVDADVVTAGKYIQVINKDKGIVYVYKNRYEMARIKIDGVIYSGTINSEGTSVIEYSTNGNKTELGIYDKSGNKKYNIKLSNNIIGKYVLANDSKHLAYVDVNVNGISVQTNINVIDLSSVKEDESNSKIIHNENNSLAYDIYWNGKTVIARFDESYMIYDVNSNKKEMVNIDIGQIVNIDNYDKRYTYVKLDEQGNYILGINKMKSDSGKLVALTDAPKYFEYENGNVYVCYSDRIEAYNNFGMNIKNYDGNMVITKPVIFNNGRSVAMLVSNKLIMFTI